MKYLYLGQTENFTRQATNLIPITLKAEHNSNTFTTFLKSTYWKALQKGKTYEMKFVSLKLTGNKRGIICAKPQI